MIFKYLLSSLYITIILFAAYIIVKGYTSKINYNDFYIQEMNQFLNEKNIAKNISYCSNIECIKQLRKKIAYKKYGYGGHPYKYIFSFPLDMKIIISPYINEYIYEIVVFVHSRPQEFYERMISRKIYLKNNNVYLIYITSKSENLRVNNKLKNEAFLFNDILQFNEKSSYFNLSIQTVHMLLWSINIKYKFLLKTDIDVYINIPLIIEIIHNFTTIENYYALGKVSKTYVIRDKKYSHYVPESIIKENTYPPYLQGLGYIIPYKTVKALINSIQHVKPKIWIEDVFMGYAFKYNKIILYDLSKYIIRDIPYNISKLIQNICKYIFVHGLYPIESYILNNVYCFTDK